MKASFYILEDHLPNQQAAGVNKEVPHRYDHWLDAMTCYKDLPNTKRKALGVSLDAFSFTLIQCLPFRRGIVQGADVLLVDFLKLPASEFRSEVMSLANRCVAAFGIQHYLMDHWICSAPIGNTLPTDLANMYLWPDIPGKPETAVKRICVRGDGWLPITEFQKLYPADTDVPPFVQQVCADGVTASKRYRELKLSPWEYQQLLARTKKRLRDNKTRCKYHE